ncbi:MAG: AsmA family protein [Thiohalomonadales bacterium]
MKKPIKIISFVFVFVLLLLILTPFIITLVIDPNDYKQEISNLVKNQTGRTLTINGEINYSIFPWLGLSLGELQLSNSKIKGFSKKPFAKIKSADVRIKLMPLLSSKVEIDKIVLTGLNLTLEKNQQGITNWQDLIKKSEQNTQASQQKSDTKISKSDSSKKDSTTTTILPAIAGIELVEANINWNNKQLDQNYELKNVNFTTGVIADNTPTNIDIQFSFKANHPELSGKTSLSANVLFDTNSQKVVIHELKLQQKLNRKFQKPNDINLNLLVDEITANLKNQTASVSKLNISVLDLVFNGSFKATNILSDINVSGNLSTVEFSPKNILKKLQITLPEMSDKNVLKKAKLDMSLVANSDKVTIPTLSLKFDDTTLKGNLSLANFSKPQISFKLHLDDINVDRYLPLPEKESKNISKKATPKTPSVSASASSKNNVDTAISLPVDLLRTLDVKGGLTLGKAIVSKLQSSDIKLNLLVKNGILRAFPISAKMYQGQYSGDITLNVQKKIPIITINESISGISFKPLLIDYMGKEYLSGYGTAKAKLTTKGITTSQFTKNLNGTASFNIKDSKIKYLNVKYRIKNEINKLMKKPLEKERYDNPNVFKIMKGTFQIKNGIAHNRDFITESRDVNLNGKGYIDLITNTVNYNANIIIQKDLKTGDKNIDKELKLLTKRPIPTPITGPLTNLSVKPKVFKTLQKAHEEMLKQKLKNEQKKVEQKAKDKMKDEQKKIENKLKQKLKDLFK